jgi:hypothetical protein
LIHQFCPILPLNRTKVFHVKRFGTIDGLRTAPSQGDAAYGAGIWGLCNPAIILSFGFVIFLNLFPLAHVLIENADQPYRDLR